MRWGVTGYWGLAAVALLVVRVPAQFQFRLGGLRDGLTFGQPFELVVERAWPAVERPVPFDAAALHPLEVRLIEAAVHPEGELLVERRRYEARALRAGELTIGPVEVRARDAEGREHGEVFEVPPVRVSSTLSDPPGEIEWPQDVRDLVAAWPRWPWAAAVVVALGGAMVLWWRRRRGAPVELAPPGPTPAELARAELAALQLPGDGDGSGLGFYTALAEVVRRFASRRFGLRAEVRTSEELQAALRAGAAPLRRCLSACDLVKFAAVRPSRQAHADCVQAAAEFVDSAEAER